jgi:hypothetical protein
MRAESMGKILAAANRLLKNSAEPPLRSTKVYFFIDAFHRLAHENLATR